MAKWSLRAQVIDTGVMVMGSEFITYNAVKVVMPDGKRKFVGKVMMHNEIENIFSETQGDFVDLYFCGYGKEDYVSVLYGIKTEKEDLYRKDNPNKNATFVGIICIIMGLPFLTIGIGFLIITIGAFMLWTGKISKPPSRKFFDNHNAEIHGHDIRGWKAGRGTSVAPA